MSAASAATLDAAAPVGDLEALLAPISPDEPAGESLRYDPILDRIRELRRQDDPTLPQGVWRHELKKADWKGVEQEAADALRSRSKDLQIAGWLCEAWLRRDGLPGLVRGLDLVAGLCARYWESIYPRPDEPDGPDDAEEGVADAAGVDLSLRVAPLGWLAAAVPEGLLSLPMTRPRGDEAEPLTWGDWKHALYVENLAATRPDAAAELEGVRRDPFLASAGLTEAAFYHRLVAGAEASLAALARLDAMLDARCGPDAPGLGAAREALEGVARLARRVSADRGEPVPDAKAPAASAPEPDPAAPDDEPAPAAPEGPPGPAPSSPCTLNSRADAYRALEQAAELLLRLEPHSPVPYLVRRAVHWGGLSLSELYDELFTIADPKSVFRLLGIREGGGEGK